MHHDKRESEGSSPQNGKRLPEGGKGTGRRGFDRGEQDKTCQSYKGSI